MKLLKIVGLVMVVLLLTAAPAVAEPTSTSFSGAGVGAGLGMAFSIVGAGYGLGRIGSAAVESMARQPEVAPKVQTAMIIIAAMLEGATLASVVFCFVIGLKASF